MVVLVSAVVRVWGEVVVLTQGGGAPGLWRGEVWG